MSIRAIAWAWKQEIPGMAKLVLLTLADHHNDETQQCNPRTKRIAEKAGIAQSSVKKQLAILQDMELIAVQQNRREDGSLTASDYTLMLLKTAGGQASTPDGLGNTPGRPQEPVIEPIKEPGSPESFEPKGSQDSSPSAHKQVMDWYQKALGYKIPNGSKEGQAVKWMLSNGYTPEDVQGCYQHLKAQHFWADKDLSLVIVKREVGAWKQWKASNSAAARPMTREDYLRDPKGDAEREKWQKLKQEVEAAQEAARVMEAARKGNAQPPEPI